MVSLESPHCSEDSHPIKIGNCTFFSKIGGNSDHCNSHVIVTMASGEASELPSKLLDETIALFKSIPAKESWIKHYDEAMKSFPKDSTEYKEYKCDYLRYRQELMETKENVLLNRERLSKYFHFRCDASQGNKKL